MVVPLLTLTLWEVENEVQTRFGTGSERILTESAY